MSDKDNSGALPEDIKNDFLSSIGRKNSAEEIKQDAPPENEATEQIHLFADEKPVKKDADDEIKNDGALNSGIKKDVFSKKPASRDSEKKPKEKTDKTEKKKEKTAEPEKQKKGKDAVKPSAPVEAKMLKDGKLPMVKAIFFVMIFPSVILLFLPFFMKLGNSVTYPIVAIFWLCLLFTGITMLVLKLTYAPNIRAMYKGKSNGFYIYRFFSVINFFRNKKAVIADICFFVMTVVLILTLALSSRLNISTYVTAVVFSLFLLSLNYHVYFNDSIYEYNSKNSTSKPAERNVADNE